MLCTESGYTRRGRPARGSGHRRKAGGRGHRNRRGRQGRSREGGQARAPHAPSRGQGPPSGGTAHTGQRGTQPVEPRRYSATRRRATHDAAGVLEGGGDGGGRTHYSACISLDDPITRNEFFQFCPTAPVSASPQAHHATRAWPTARRKWPATMAHATRITGCTTTIRCVSALLPKNFWALCFIHPNARARSPLLLHCF